MATKHAGDNQENACIVCYKGVEIYSVGECDHPVCFECSTRMRVLCRQNECPICRRELPQVIFVRGKFTYNELKHVNGPKDDKFQIVFYGKDVENAYYSLLAHECPECFKNFTTFNELKEHVRRVHQLKYCDLCIENLKIFTKERRCYNRKDLTTHKRTGDEDNKSHRGHPLCEFCDTRYMDVDELYRHLRRDHLYCHLCDSDGLHQYYDSYDGLRDHFRSEHYLCEEGDCSAEEFTKVFRTEIDLKAHRASAHGKTIGKAGLKQARTLEFEFTLVPRPPRTSRHRGGGPGGGGGGEDDQTQSHHNQHQMHQSQHQMHHSQQQTRLTEESGAVGGVVREQPPLPPSINTAYKDEFPSLGGSATDPVVPFSSGGRKFHMSSSYTRSKLNMNDENFPALETDHSAPPHGPSSVPYVERPVSSVLNTKPPNVCIQVHHPRGFTAKVTCQNNFKDTEEDFPALSNNVASSSVMKTASVQWSSGKKPEPKVSVAIKPPDPPRNSKQMTNFHIRQTDFPSLSPKVEVNATSGKLSAAHKVGQNEINKPGVSSTGTLTEPTNKKSHKSKVAEPPDCALANLSLSNVDGPKKKKTKSKPNNNQSANLLDSLEALDSTVSRKGKSKSKNINKPNETPKPTAFVSSQSDSKKKSKLSAVNDSSFLDNENTFGELNNNRKIVSNNEPHSSMSNGLVSNEDFPPMDSSGDSAFGGKSKNKKNKKKSPLLVPQEDVPPPVNSPTVPPGFSDVCKKAPPGFCKPPPGLSPTVPLSSSSTDTQKPPPGFSAMDENLFPPLVEEIGYHMPSNFVKRNGNLVQRLIISLDQGTLESFKDISTSFRESAISAEHYFTLCKEFLGPLFEDVFPELLALLPDIQKQQELWPLYESNFKQKASSLPGKKGKKEMNKRLEVCLSCGQVIALSDLKEHFSKHYMANQFASSTSQPIQPGAKNAWSSK